MPQEMGELDLKRRIHQALIKQVKIKIRTAEEALRAAQESKSSETKSSAGDKHETGRAMMQREEEQNQVQLGEALKLRNALSQIDLAKTYDRIELGSLVITDQGKFFMSVGLGKVEVDGDEFYAISPASPLGQLFLFKKARDQFNFGDTEYSVVSIA